MRCGAQLDGDLAGPPPKVVLDRLKTQCVQPLQETQYDLSRAINNEKRSIEKILSLQQAGLTLLWTLTVSVSIGLSNYFFPRLLNTYGDVYVAVVLGVIVALAGAGFIARVAASDFGGKRRAGGCCTSSRTSEPPARHRQKRQHGGHSARVLPATEAMSTKT